MTTTDGVTRVRASDVAHVVTQLLVELHSDVSRRAATVLDHRTQRAAEDLLDDVFASALEHCAAMLALYREIDDLAPWDLARTLRAHLGTEPPAARPHSRAAAISV